MEIFLIADTHFYHKNIIEYCNRPFDNVEVMNKTIIENWNSVVSKDDIVIHVGDVAFGDKDKIESILENLNGYKILIKRKS